MPRRKRGRRMLMPPVVKGMSVYGVRGRKAQDVQLLFEEYEVIRLLDYRGMTQEEAAVHMKVSRPTLTRIYEDARNKVAKAFVEGRDLSFKGGNFFFDDDWHKCNSCDASFSSFEKGKPECALCGSADVITLNEHYQKLN